MTNEIENIIEKVKKEKENIFENYRRYITQEIKHRKKNTHDNPLFLFFEKEAELKTFKFCNDILKKKELELEENQQISDRISTLIKERDEIKEKAQEDLKKQIQIEKIEKGKYKFEDFEIYGIIDKVFFGNEEDN